MKPKPPTEREERRLIALEHYEILDTPADSSFDDLTKIAAHIFDVPISLISLVDRRRQWFKSRHGLEATETPREISFCQYVVADEATLVVEDAWEDPRFSANPLVVGNPEIRFYAGAPLFTPENYVLGTLCVIDRKPRVVSPEALELLNALARKATELLELRYQAQRASNYQELFNSSNSLAAIAGFDGHFKQLNPAWQQTLGFSEAELRAKPFLEFVHPEDHSSTEEIAACLAKGHAIVNFENRYVCKDGSFLWLHWTATSNLEKKQIYASAINITERKIAEQAAQDNSVRLHAIFDNVVDGLFTADDRGTIQSFNPAACRIFQYTAEELLGKSIDVLAPDTLGASRPLDVAHLISSHIDPLIGRTRELSGRRKNGTRFPLELALSETYIGGKRMFTGIARDISQRKEVERMKSEFVSTVSHELRTPLTSIRGSLRLVEGGVVGAISEPAHELVRVAVKNTDRLIRLINDLLDLEKMGAGQLELNIEPLSGKQLIDRTIEGLESMATHANVRLQALVQTDIDVAGDPDRLLQVLANLVSNAIKYSSDGGQVLISLKHCTTHTARFSVHDQGQGIPSEQQQKLFRKFHQLDSSDTRSKGGSGLGLAISKQIIEQHEGEIGVDSQSGQGSTFWFELESIANQSKPMLDTALPSSFEQPHPGGVSEDSRPVVLLIGTDDQLADTLRRETETQNCILMQVDTIAEASSSLHTFRPAAILLNLSESNVTSLNILRRAHFDNPYLNVPIVVLTEAPFHPGASPRPSFVNWLSKPVDPCQLKAALTSAMKLNSRPRVLIAEDDPSVRQVVVTLLDELGVLCLEANNGQVAIDIARNHRPHLLILDVGLPGLDGYSVVEALRQDGNRSLPMITYSGQDLNRSERRRLELGVTRHLLKSRASEEEFLDHIHELLGDRLTQGEAAGRLGPLLRQS